MRQLQTEVKALRETFLRAIDIVEKMGQSMDTLAGEAVDNRSTNTFIHDNSSRRTKRTLKCSGNGLSIEASHLVISIAEKMKNVPLQNLRKIRSGNISIV